MNSNAYGKVPTAVWVVGYVVVGGVVYWLLTRKPSTASGSTASSSSSLYGHPIGAFVP